MALFSFFRTPKHQKFNYIPRYYNPQKERLQEILNDARGEGKSDAEIAKSRISNSFRRRTGSYRSPNQGFMSRSNILLLAIIVVLFGLTYLLLTVYLPEFIAKIEG